MSHVNYWLLALSFVLGLVLTLAFMIRRVKREVPVYDSAKFTSKSTAQSRPGSASETSEPKTEVISTPTVEEPKTEVIRRSTVAGAAGAAGGESKTEVISIPPAAAAGAAGAAGLVGGADLAGSGKDSGDASGEEPYGAGSFRLVGGATVPSGWTIKGNEDSMLYHTPDSPSYKQTIAELWFRDEDTAKNAGFRHWKEGRAKSGAAKLAATEPEVPPGPHGPGSATPGPGGSGPEGWTVKGNEDSKLYHSPESPSYGVTVAEVWFRDVPTAEAAGFNRWDSGKSQRGKK